MVDPRPGPTTRPSRCPGKYHASTGATQGTKNPTRPDDHFMTCQIADQIERAQLVVRPPGHDGRMASEVRNEVVAGALDACRAALVTLHAADLVPADVDDAKALVRDLEAIWRMTGAAQVSVLGEIARSGVHRQDGHHSAKVLVRHVGRLSDGEAGRREQVRRALADLPVVFASYRAGRIGPCQVQAIARVWANPRVRAALIDQDAAAARLAERLSYRALALQLRTWERLVDQDGAEDRARAGHEARNATAHQGFDGSWTGAWNCGALEGAVRRSILDAFERAEYEADWATARADLGDSATQADLCRTDAQRRSDALGEIFRCAADHHAAAPGGAPILTTLLIDQATFEAELRRQAVEPRSLHLACHDLPVQAAQSREARRVAQQLLTAGDCPDLEAYTISHMEAEILLLSLGGLRDLSLQRSKRGLQPLRSAAIVHDVLVDGVVSAVDLGSRFDAGTAIRAANQGR